MENVLQFYYFTTHLLFQQKCLKLHIYNSAIVKCHWATVVTACLRVCLSVRNVGILWPNGCMDQDVTWYGSRPYPRPHCVR